ncbi:MAG: hexokinase [Amphiamblys sp. WSBS2006]|nr:MAG: hexokinase [Amphiamblys sp. WSBS2006]
MESLGEGTELFHLQKEKLREMTVVFLKEFYEKLGTEGRHTTMLDTHVPFMPTGQETGTFLTLDVGGTNLRVCCVSLLGDRKTKSYYRVFRIPAEKKTGTGRELFDFVAACIEKSIPELLRELEEKQKVKMKTKRFGDKQKYPLSFTFSFPVEQKTISSGKLLSLSKGFTCSGMVGEDIVELLQSSLDARNTPVQIVTLINDSVGTLMSAAYKKNNVIAGVVIGTGTNAAYFDESKKTVINTEWGDFRPSILPRNVYDGRLDESTENRESHLFEKMISGKYLGELFRLVLADHQDAFEGETSLPETPFAVDTAEMSEFFRMKEQPIENFGTKKKIFGVELTKKNRELLVRICEKIYRRSASLVAVGISALYLKVGGPKNQKINISIDGSIYSKIIQYATVLNDYIAEILPEDSYNIVVTEESDGSSIGGAVVAALKLEKEGLT